MFSKEENEIFEQGYKIIGGIDEAGRGPLAGPVVTAAVLIDRNFKGEIFFSGNLKDSKSLSEKQREEIFEKIKKSDINWRVSMINSRVIDDINIWQATLLGWHKALNKFKNLPDFLFIDGKSTLKSIKVPQEPVIGGDKKILSIALASIIAKVTRDELMKKIDKKYPEYGFFRHKGYGTKIHLENLKKYGPSRIHRKSFQPVFENLCFEDKVYYVVSKIPKGKVMTYKEVACKIGYPSAYRAVGRSLNRNRNPKVPCYRVIRSDGSLGGYNRGDKLKKKILKQEGF